MVVAAVLVTAAAVLFLARARRGERPGAAPARLPTPTPVPVVVSRLKVSSPDLKVGIGKLYAAPERDGTWWEFVIVCQELEGCHGELELDLAYTENGRAGHVTHREALDLPSLGQRKVRFIERPRHPVEAVEGVTVRLLRRDQPGAPRPRPIY